MIFAGKPTATAVTTIPLRGPLLRGSRRPRVALVGRYGVGKTTIFTSAASPAVHQERLAGFAGEGEGYLECVVNVGLDQITLVDLPAMDSLHHLSAHDRALLMYILWGSDWPFALPPEGTEAGPEFAAPDVLVQVVDATTLEQDLELTLELSLLGRPLVIALNRIDEARRKGLFINVPVLEERLGVRVVPTIAHMGKGLSALFEAVTDAVRADACPLPQPPARHIDESLHALRAIAARPEIEAGFGVPRTLLVQQLAVNDDYFLDIVGTRFPELLSEIAAARATAEKTLPRLLEEELHADRHHRAALLHEAVTRPHGIGPKTGWRHWLDGIFLHPRWGLVGTLLVFALVLFMVFEMSAFLDGLTSARLMAHIQEWQPASTLEVVGRAVAEGLTGLVGIVIPYMLPLVLLLVVLEESGVMHRVAFVVDRGFHYLGLHGGVAVPFLIGLGCNVPAISAAAMTGSRRERTIAAILITFVPCSARSAIILAIGGKYLGGLGVFAIFALTLTAIAVLGKLLARRYADSAPGLVQSIPPYALPKWNRVWRKTWERTSDIVTIVTPLLVIGSIVLALLSHFGADAFINMLLTPITSWWLGLPVVLGVPILFGVLRKELSLLMIYQALDSLEIAPLLSDTQIFTFLIFLTFYVPCLSTFAVMVKTLGRKEAGFSVLVSLVSALLAAGAVRLVMELLHAIRSLT
ncbi:ferrous iron transporter B [Propionivibrio limicola]|uniref:ferrous iron transporter B n=1 Tax=Propionivibrio limicola TaxID=167645 RepID=UPI0012924687|nr:ferrous iron transporter B [Propionivibrio limicola]